MHATIIINGEKSQSNPIKIRNKTGMSPIPSFFNIELEALAREIGQEKKMKRMIIGKEVHLSLSSDGMIIHKSQKFYQKTPRNDQHFQQSSRPQHRLPRSITFLYINSKELIRRS